jgi:hypothetical protein
VDAALDNVNVQKVASFIQRRASRAVSARRGLSPLQFLVISLKDSFFSQADLLVGIYRDASAVCSRRMCLDLTAYGQAAAGAAGAAGAAEGKGAGAARPAARRQQEEEEEEEVEDDD